MPGSTEVLQQYLVKLGYQIDEVSDKKFLDSLSKTEKTIFKTGAAVTSLIAAVETASVRFAYSMRKIYFESELANSSVKNLKALSFAGKQIGIDGATMESAIHGMAQAMRLNPGLQGLVESFGVKVTGRDTSDVMVDFVKALKQMPEFAAAKYAAMFGMDPDTYHQMINHMDELTERRQKMLDIYAETGFDPEISKKAILDYTASLDELEARLSVLGSAILVKMQPAFKTTTDYIVKQISYWTKLASGKNPLTLDKYTAQAAAQTVKGAEQAIGKKVLGWVEPYLPKLTPRGIRNNNPGNLNFAKQDGATLEAGANGRFAVFKTMSDGVSALADQLARYNAKGINTIEAIIEKYAPKKDGNNTAAYIKNLSKSLGISPKDTIDLMKHPEMMEKLMQGIIQIENGKTINRDDLVNGLKQSRFGKANLSGVNSTRLGDQASNKNVNLTMKTEINVTGSDPRSTGKEVERVQGRVYADVLRNMKGALA